MKTAACCLVLAGCLAAAAAGSAPYLPSGWRPEGPAFLLPSEVQKPADNPLKNSVEVEASGSDFLREYGPPAISQVSQDITRQALPEVSTDHSFSIEAGVNNAETSEQAFAVQKEAHEEYNYAHLEQATAVQNEAYAENNQLQVQQETAVQSNAKAEENTAHVEEVVIGAKNSANYHNEASAAAVVEDDRQGKSLDEDLKNLEQDINSQQVNSEAVAEVKTIQQEAGVSADVPAGFLEYGPPTGASAAHTEYGPPAPPAARSALSYPAAELRSAVADDQVDASEEPTTTEVPTTEVATEATPSETRRRRFSPRFRSARRTD